jgi:hypothetical protein
MIPPRGDYRYEIVRAGELLAVEEERLTAEELSGVRRSGVGSGRYEVKAQLGPDVLVIGIALRYTREPFSRSASYRVDGDLLSGSIEAMAARHPAEAKLGRHREVDADLTLFKALIIAHARSREEMRFTGRIATIDPNTLLAASRKQTYRRSDAAGTLWICEPLMGESEEIELDREGRIVRRRGRGIETVLREFRPAQPQKT